MAKHIFLRFLDSYFRHRWLNLFPILLMAIAAVINFALSERLYISTGVLVVQQRSLLASITSVTNEGFSWNTPAQDTSSEIYDLMQSNSFVLAAINATDKRASLTEPDADITTIISEMRKHMWVVAVGTYQVSINAADADPEIARQMAQAIIDKYLQWKSNTSHLDSAAAVDFLAGKVNDKVAKHQEAQDALMQYLITHPDPIDGSRPESEQLIIENLRSNLSFAGTQMGEAIQKKENAEIAYAQVDADVRQKYFLIDAPVVPEKVALSKRQIATKFGTFLLAGLILSIFLVIGSMVWSQALWFPADARNWLSLPVLAELPDIPEPTVKRRLNLFQKKSSNTEREKTQDNQ